MISKDTPNNDLLTLENLEEEFIDYLDLDGGNGGEMEFKLNGEEVICFLTDYQPDNVKTDPKLEIKLTREQYIELVNFIDIDMSANEVYEKLVLMGLINDTIRIDENNTLDIFFDDGSYRIYFQNWLPISEKEFDPHANFLEATFTINPAALVPIEDVKTTPISFQEVRRIVREALMAANRIVLRGVDFQRSIIDHFKVLGIDIDTSDFDKLEV